jgi:hypothetical protein
MRGSAKQRGGSSRTGKAEHFDVVFDEHWYAVQSAETDTFFTFTVAFCSHFASIVGNCRYRAKSNL